MPSRKATAPLVPEFDAHADKYLHRSFLCCKAHVVFLAKAIVGIYSAFAVATLAFFLFGTQCPMFSVAAIQPIFSASLVVIGLRKHSKSAVLCAIVIEGLFMFTGVLFFFIGLIMIVGHPVHTQTEVDFIYASALYLVYVAFFTWVCSVLYTFYCYLRDKEYAKAAKAAHFAGLKA